MAKLYKGGTEEHPATRRKLTSLQWLTATVTATAAANG
jgi:hypothetical protein